MALLKVYDRVVEASTSTGIGDMVLAGALAGFQAFSSVYSDNDQLPYFIIGTGTHVWESGIATFHTSTNSFSRTTVKANSSHTTSPLTLAADTYNCGVDLGAFLAGINVDIFNLSAGSFLQWNGTNVIAGVNPTKYALLTEETVSGTDASTISANVWNVHKLSHLSDYDSIGITLSSYQFTLPAGTYNVLARGSYLGVSRERLRLYNVTAQTPQAYGTSEYADIAGISVDSHLPRTRLSLTASTVFQLEHWSESVFSQSAGVATGGSATSLTANEIYAYVDIEKIG